MKEKLVECPLCSKVLPFDYIHCPGCATPNPHMENANVRKLEVLMDDSVFRAIERKARESGRKIDTVIQEALEMYVSSFVKRRA